MKSEFQLSTCKGLKEKKKKKKVWEEADEASK